jgi:hypothetical protein
MVAGRENVPYMRKHISEDDARSCRKAVLAWLEEHGPGGQAKLTKVLGLGKATVSTLVGGGHPSFETAERVREKLGWIPSWARTEETERAAPRVLHLMKPYADEIARAVAVGDPYPDAAIALLNSYPGALEDVSPEDARAILRALAFAAEAVDRIVARPQRPRARPFTPLPVSGERSTKAVSVVPVQVSPRRK